MTEYKIIFESGVMVDITAGSIELNDVLDKVEVKDDDGKEMEELYLNFEDISAIIPQS
ncbi:hypothetical protein [Fodinibius sp.]|uniref:hypothetical protein n=1 Tax=Fodinibius sp. TaxID=1872440 RepID=UPI002ACE4AD5|nr:hypothetical protein [Fodinibius sp.]MDZ7658171.1 hypothetical protein [Fodinibius sp.]